MSGLSDGGGDVTHPHSVVEYDDDPSDQLQVPRFMLVCRATVLEEIFHWNLNSADDKITIFKRCLLLDFYKSLMMANIIEIKKIENSLTFNFLNLATLSQFVKLNSLYIFILCRLMLL